MKSKILSTFYLMVAFVLFSSCSDEKTPEEEPIKPDQPYLNLDATSVEFSYYTESKTIAINTNIPGEEITCKVVTGNWCTAELKDGQLILEANSSNMTSSPRTTSVSVTGQKIYRSVTVRQKAREIDGSSIKTDIKLPVKRGTASSYQGGGEIQKSFDGDMNTIYHSNWTNTSASYFPINLTYEFENVSTMDYLVYYPRTSGSNGHFKEFKLYVTTETKPEYEYGTYDFQGSGAASQVTFSPALEKPTKIRFHILSGAGDGQGFASCAEMEFYRKNDENFNPLTVFTDNSCSELKSGVTEADIEAISDPFFKTLALEIQKGIYDSEFRVQKYKAYKNPAPLAETNKTGTQGMRDNPTGIYSQAGEEIIMLVENPKGYPISLFIQDVNNGVNGSSYILLPGVNKIQASASGLMYINYYTKEGNEPDVKINIVTGTVNGYFDSKIHKKEDWERLLNKATFKHFDLVGKYAIATFETGAFRSYTPDGLALINKYDDLVRLEYEFMGLFKYGRDFKNKSHLLVVYGDNFMFSAGSYTGYNNGTQADILDINKLGTVACWGPAHEVGHSLQTRPGFKWVGMTEVTNNVLSLHVQTAWGNTSRLISESRYANAKTLLLKTGVPYNKSNNDVFLKLVPLWQLKLYLHDALGKTDFYKDFYEAIRRQQNVNVSVLTEAYYQLEFVKIVCDVAQLDLTEFFESWGFLTEINETISDYSTANFKITSAQIKETKDYIAKKNYPKPKHNNIFDITDSNVSSFK